MTTENAQQARPDFRVSVHRPSPSATWTHEHRWGTSFGDTTTLRVTRVAGGEMEIAYGKESFRVRRDLVEVFAAMVAEANGWVDES